MIGEKKLSAIMAAIRDAFARRGIDVDTWLDQQASKLRRRSSTRRAVLESLMLLRDGLRRNRSAKKKRMRKAKTRS